MACKYKVGDYIQINSGRKGTIKKINPSHVLLDIGDKDGLLVVAKWRIRKIIKR